MKNHESRVVDLIKFNTHSYVFPTLDQAVERGELELKNPKYNAFNTMEINQFIETMYGKFGLGK